MTDTRIFLIGSGPGSKQDTDFASPQIVLEQGLKHSKRKTTIVTNQAMLPPTDAAQV